MKIVRAMVLSVLVISLPAIAAPAHQHGSAKIDISVEGNKFTIGLEMPLDSTIGSERPARTDKEKLAYASMMAALKNPAGLFTPTAAAKCRVESCQVSDPFPGGKPKPDGHADIDAEYLLICANPAALKGFETTLFKQFKRLQKIDVQRTTPSGQGKMTMTPGQASAAW